MNVRLFVAIVALAIGTSTGVAAAQLQVDPADPCVGVDHFPDQPVGDNPSKLIFGGAFDPSLAGGTWTIFLDGASGSISGEGVIGSDGVGYVDVGINSYGEHTATGSTITQTGGSTVSVGVSGFGSNGSIVVDAGEAPCGPVAPVPATTTASTTTTTKATATTAAPSTTQAPPTSTAPTTTASPEPSSPGTGWGTPAVVIGLVLIGLGFGIFVRGKDGRSCRPLLEEWQHRLRMLDQVKQGLADAKAHLAELEQRVTHWRDELTKLERTRAGSVTEHGTTYHLIEGGRVTSEGLEDLIDSHREALESAERDAADGGMSVEGWEQRLVQALAHETEARTAYEQCIGEAIPAPAPAPEPEPPTGPQPPGPAVASPPDEEPPVCVDGARKVEPAGRADSMKVIRDFSIIVEVEEGSERNVDGAKDMAVNLSGLAGELGSLGSILGMGGAGKAIKGGFKDLAAGSYVKGSAGFVEGGIGGYIAIADPNIGTAGFPVSIPTSPQEAVTELLEAAARLGALVASKVGEWMAKNQLYRIRLTYFEQEIKATPYNVYECQGGSWMCVEKVYLYEVGNLTKRPGPTKSDITIRDELQRHRFEREINGLTASARRELQRSMQERSEFEAAHQPGPCGS